MLPTSPFLCGGNQLCAVPIAVAYTKEKAIPWHDNVRTAKTNRYCTVKYVRINPTLKKSDRVRRI